MTRKKVKLAFILNDSTRRTTYKKRKRGLMKKVAELSTLCGIDACAVIYSSYENEPVVWPSAFGVHRVLAKFKNMPEIEQNKKMVNQETFLKQRIMKTEEQVTRMKKDNREKEMTQLMINCVGTPQMMTHTNLTVSDVNDLAWVVEQTIKDIDRRMDTLRVQLSEMAIQNQIQMAASAAQASIVAANEGEMALVGPGNEAAAEPISFGDHLLQSDFWHRPLM